MFTRLPDRRVPAMRFIGLARWFAWNQRREIPSVWAAFIPREHEVTGTLGGATYGICFEQGHDGLRYGAAFAVTGAAVPPEGMEVIETPALDVAAYDITGPIAAFQKNMDAVMEDFYASGGTMPQGKPIFELYDERFDGTTGTVTVWIPLG